MKIKNKDYLKLVSMLNGRKLLLKDAADDSKFFGVLYAITALGSNDNASVQETLWKLLEIILNEIALQKEREEAGNKIIQEILDEHKKRGPFSFDAENEGLIRNIPNKRKLLNFYKLVRKLERYNSSDEDKQRALDDILNKTIEVLYPNSPFVSKKELNEIFE